VEQGQLFVAVRGLRLDGHDYLGEVARAGAAACFVEKPEAVGEVPRVLVADAEAALGRAASAFWGHPSKSLRLIGVTGTNGKTTVAYLIRHLLQTSGIPAGRLGTVSYAYPSGEEPAALTTPDAATLQRALARTVREGARAGVMEVSSHALSRRRVEGCVFACAVFTNLTQDHLDFHHSMEEYFAAKRLLFTRYAPAVSAVVNAEDPYGKRLAAELGGAALTFGLERGDVRLRVREVTAEGVTGDLLYPGGRTSVRVPLTGAFNARNAACALATVWSLGLNMETAAHALAEAPQVPGRVEAIENSLGISIFVDYAHTPDALHRLLEAMRRVSQGRLTCVFGCGGDRDRGKRPLMAGAAARWCDALVLTADNSRSERSEAILDDIEAGLPTEWTPAASPNRLGRVRRSYARVPDRAEAIRWAVAAARPGDAVVIAGKGHETTQTLGDKVLPFDDRAEARAAVAEREQP
jgi:UDP-N-acetylmuramoyl-L-alanyl-D-glutamate--2,6-diaminopimelate ligase